MDKLLWVALGGALGSSLRYMLGVLLNSAFPYGTLAVNLLGCFAMGALVGYGAFAGQVNEQTRLLLAVGVLGGFTTFSSFSLDVLTMVEKDQLTLALGYIGITVIGSLFAVFAGSALVKALT